MMVQITVRARKPGCRSLQGVIQSEQHYRPSDQLSLFEAEGLPPVLVTRAESGYVEVTVDEAGYKALEGRGWTPPF